MFGLCGHWNECSFLVMVGMVSVVEYGKRSLLGVTFPLEVGVKILVSNQNEFHENFPYHVKRKKIQIEESQL